jgi:hypothetical protein
LNDLKNTDSSYLLIGAENSGKSITAKRFVQLHLKNQIEGDYSNLIFYFDCRELKIKKGSAFKNWLLEFYCSKENSKSFRDKLERKIDDGAITVVVDSIESLNTDGIENLFFFIKNNTNVKYILIGKHTIHNEFSVKIADNSLKPKFIEVKIGGFKRSNVRQLVEKWEKSTTTTTLDTYNNLIMSLAQASAHTGVVWLE